MLKSLLEQAKNLEPEKNSLVFTDEEVELALAWLDDRVMLWQVGRVVKRASSTSIYLFLARALRQACTEGKLEIKK